MEQDQTAKQQVFKEAQRIRVMAMESKGEKENKTYCNRSVTSDCCALFTLSLTPNPPGSFGRG
jgi:hypothetical protein